MSTIIICISLCCVAYAKVKSKIRVLNGECTKFNTYNTTEETGIQWLGTIVLIITLIYTRYI